MTSQKSFYPNQAVAAVKSFETQRLQPGNISMSGTKLVGGVDSLEQLVDTVDSLKLDVEERVRTVDTLQVTFFNLSCLFSTNKIWKVLLV